MRGLIPSQIIITMDRTKLFYSIVHYKRDKSTGEETTISEQTGVHVKDAKRFRLKAYRNGYKYNRVKGEYVKETPSTTYHLVIV